MDMEYRQCSRCVMDNASDNTIVFNQEGYCNYCTEAIETLQERYFPNEAGAKKLDELLTILKKKEKTENMTALWAYQADWTRLIWRISVTNMG